jgi:hypothetical protein
MPSLPNTPQYHWSPANQRAFLEELSITGNVETAAKSVSMSKHSAYRLRYRNEGAAFRLGWEAAILIARGRLVDTLMERALDGVEEVMTRSSDGDTISRVKQDNRLGMSMLARLDNRCEPKDDDLISGHDTAIARLISGDFEAFLDLIENGGTGASAALFLAARCDLELIDGHSNLSQNSADCEHESPVEKIRPEPEIEAAEMSVWYCEYDLELRTNFPPPNDFDGKEDGIFGDEGYERELSDAEQEAQMAMHAKSAAPLKAAGIIAREAYFKGYLEEEEAVVPKPVMAVQEIVPYIEPKLCEDICEDVADTVDPDIESAPPTQNEPEVSTHNILYCQPQPHYLIPPWGERIC